MKPELTLFYADDDQEDLEIFREITDSIGNVALHTVDNGDKLLELLENPPPQPHIVFLDLNMPGKTGFTVLEEMRNQEKFADLPIVIFSTSQDREDVERTRKMGANFFVSKQASYDAYKNSIQHTLSINWPQFTPDASNFQYKN